MSASDGATGQVRRSAAEIYEQFFVPALFGQWPGEVLDAAGVGAGHRVLDIGCGTGVLARAAQERVGDRGQVVGIDVNAGMLAVAERISNGVTWRRGAAEDLSFPDQSFDRVVTQFALMFFTDRDRALREMARVLAPGGRVAIATWAAVDESPGYSAMVRLLRREIGADAARALLAPFCLGDTDALRELIAPVFADVEVRRCEGLASFASLEDWLHTDVRGWTLADMIDDEAYDRLLLAARSELARFVGPRGSVCFPAPALIATASASAAPTAP